MKLKTILPFLICMFMLPIVVVGQEAEEHHSLEEEKELHHHSITLSLSHSFISLGVKDGDRDWLMVPSWAINYNYKFDERWSLGLHNDIIFEEFIVEDTRENTEQLERSYPISSILVTTYMPIEGWGLALGGGLEYEKNESFGLVRIGTEYALSIPKGKLEVVFALNYDILIDAYDSINIGIGIAKLF